MATSSPKGGSPALDAVMAAIQESKEEISRQIDAKTTSIQSSLSKIETLMSTPADQVEEMEGCISANEDNMKDATMQIGKLEKEVQSLRDKVEDLENRIRCNNIRILSLPKDAEGCDAVGFLERVIPEIHDIENFPPPITSERAHRLGKPPTGRGDAPRPRPMIAKLLNFKNKEKIMRQTKGRDSLQKQQGSSQTAISVCNALKTPLRMLKRAFGKEELLIPCIIQPNHGLHMRATSGGLHHLPQRWTF